MWAEGLRHVPGDVIEICDDDYAVSASAGACWREQPDRTLTLDREITLPSSGTTLISLVVAERYGAIEMPGIWSMRC
ncbi:hypothetical protein [Escherichia coli]|uniref:hypothetical protein n=1 Tax=Escherichia coli TaxID=562 RepID=UPI001F44960A|nr:hypothetical protein [Escherichia coli]